jgi:type I restriction enzyme, S subunit
MSSKTKTTASKEEARPALVPKLRFPEFRKAEGWKESRLSGSKGNVARKITVKLWGNGVFEKNDAIQGSINTQYYRRKAGQFIYSKLDFLNQAFGIIPPNLDNFESTVDLPCFDFAVGLNSVFLLEYVKRRDFYERLGETADGSRKARRIHAETFLSFPIALPTPPEQQKIAECLSSVDELIAAQARKVDALKTHKKGLMQQLFPREGETQPRLRFPEFQNAGEWVEKTLVDACRMQAGKFVTAAEIKDQNAGDLFPCYGGNGLRGFTATFTHDGVYPLIGRQGALCGNVKLASGQFHATEHAVVATPRQGVEVVWIYYVLDLLNLNRFATGQAQPGLSVDVLEKVPIAIPKDKAEQQRVAECLTSLDALIAAQTQKHEALKTHKQGLMQQLFPSPEVVAA